MEDNVKEINLQRSESYGFGFSIIGGLGSELPPVICDIVEDSPAANCEQLQAGDVIVSVNGSLVAAYTTKEVLKCLRLSGPRLQLLLKEDVSVRERVAHYLSCSSDDADSLRDVISQRDLTGVEEIIVRCPASPHTPRTLSNPVSPAMPRPPSDRKANGGSSRTSPAHKTRSTAHPGASSFGYRGGGAKVHENGLDSSGKVAKAQESTPSTRHDRGFETFVMTGDMIIRTSTTSSHSKMEIPRKSSTEKRKGSGDGKSLQSPLSPKTSPVKEPSKDSKGKSRIPKPGKVGGSPKHTASQIPRPGWGEKKLKKSANFSSSTDSESAELGSASSPTPQIENLEVVNNNVIPPMAQLEDTSQESLDDIPPEVGTTDELQNEFYSHNYTPPAYTIAPELDIPPDDISSEDDNYKNIEILMNLDDLPPPPDELLHDYVPERPDESLHDASLNLLGQRMPFAAELEYECHVTAVPASVAECDPSPVEPSPPLNGDPSQDISQTMVVSKSAEKIIPRSSAQTASGVRTSKSHENYLEGKHGEAVTLVDIDFEENMASSVDALHYQDKSSTSMEQMSETSRSLENSPERAKHSERCHIPTFIRIEEPRSVIRLKDGKMRDSSPQQLQEQVLAEERLNSSHGSTESISSDLSRENDQEEAPGISHLSQEELIQNGILLERLHNSQYRPPPDGHHDPHSADFIEVHVDNHNHNNHSAQDADKSDSDGPGGESSPGGSSAHHHHSSPSHTLGATQNSDSETNSLESSPQHGSPRPRSDTMGSDGSDADSLYHQPCKDVDRPSAQRLAKRLFQLDGFQKKDVYRHLSKKNDFAQFVGDEYLKYFDFSGQTLELALRQFLRQMTLTGETQERERVLAHFSKRFCDCNPGTFNSEDACHTLTCALMLLNTDLHGQNIGRKMTLAEFIENLSDLNDGENFPRDILRQLYNAIKSEPLECEFEEDLNEFAELSAEQRAQMPDPSRYAAYNPFLEIPDPSKATEYKKGYVMRKCCIDPDGRKTPLGKRGWKMFYAVLRDTILYLYKDEHASKKSSIYDSMGNAVRIHHSLATRASDYTKKQHVFRVQTSDWAQFLFQTSDQKECKDWIDTLNFVAASLSAPPLPGACGSQRKFQRQLMPSSITKLNMREQLTHHEQKVLTLEQDLQEHQMYPPEKGAKSRLIQEYTDKDCYLQFELRRFKTYIFLLQSKMASFPELEPSLVEVAIGEVDEPPSPPDAPTQEDRTPSKPVQRSMSDSYGLCGKRWQTTGALNDPEQKEFFDPWELQKDYFVV